MKHYFVDRRTPPPPPRRESNSYRRVLHIQNECGRFRNVFSAEDRQPRRWFVVPSVTVAVAARRERNSQSSVARKASLIVAARRFALRPATKQARKGDKEVGESFWQRPRRPASRWPEIQPSEKLVCHQLARTNFNLCPSVVIFFFRVVCVFVEIPGRSRGWTENGGAWPSYVERRTGESSAAVEASQWKIAHRLET